MFTATAVWAAPQSPAPADAYTYIIQPTDGTNVPKTFDVKFGLSGMGVAPAGVKLDNTGHHHLLIDLDRLPDLTQPLQASSQLKHFGGGQTETTLTLAPGPHTLQLLLGNYGHVPHTPPVVSTPVHITVE
ncbi:MAG: DUF4399 domain-containing protein [Cyanothece sp. SIO2G6]|nr:DUF4399 domain-containing protein [Cyanothece sp. SIO2G6]